MVVVGAGVYALVLSTVSVAKYVTFTTEWDHAIFTQYLWLLAHGASPLNTLNGRFLLGDHVEPGLALLAPLGFVGGTRSDYSSCNRSHSRSSRQSSTSSDARSASTRG